MNERAERSPSTGFTTPGSPPKASLAPIRRLTLPDRLVRVPVGFLYLAFLAILAIPVMAWMTLAYYVVRGWERACAALRRAPQGGRADVERGA